MVNQLENLCEEKEIKIEFINYNFIDDASEFKYNKPVIKVHKIFKECPMKVATAIIEIFTEEGHTSECIEIIENYLVEKLGPVGIKIQPPKVIIPKPVNKAINSTYNNNKENYSNEEDLYIETDISSINVTNIKGQQKKLNNNEIIMGKEQDILELDIVIKPPTT